MRNAVQDRGAMHSKSRPPEPTDPSASNRFSFGPIRTCGGGSGGQGGDNFTAQTRCESSLRAAADEQILPDAPEAN
jgi:hypothetical protein